MLYESGKVAAVIVSYNRKLLLEEAINALLRQSKKDVLDIFVVDNASTDGTKEQIQKYIDDGLICYENTGANLGGAGGFNYGIKLVTELNKYEYVWIMDDDTIPNTDALEKFFEASKLLNNDFGFLASSVAWIDDEYCKMNYMEIFPKWLDSYKFVQDGIVRIIRATFVSLLIKTDAVRKIGLPIKEFFIWGDDQEYTDRISKSFPCYFVSKSKVVHKMASNSGSCLRDDNPERIKRYRYAYRNDLYTNRRNGSISRIIYFANIIKTTFEIIFRSPNKKIARLKTLYIGMFKGLFFFPRIEYVKVKEE